MQSFYKIVPPAGRHALPSDDPDVPLLSRLQRLASDPPVTPVRPSNSAVQAGWICIALGLLVAWWFPLGHVFFSVAMIMAVIAMSTHQVKSGFMLLASASGGIVCCWLIFIAGVTALVTSATRQPTRTVPKPPVIRQSDKPPINPTNSFLPPAIRPVPGAPSVPVTTAGNPLRWSDLMLLLRTGFQDDEIIAEASQRQLVDPVGSEQAAALRAAGAGDKLINYLQSCRLYLAPPSAAVGRQPALPIVAASLPLRGVGSVPSVAPVDYAARDRQIATLAKQIDSLDDTIRRYRTTSRNPSNQQSMDEYIKSLEQTRDGLRRQKWQLEGR